MINKRWQWFILIGTHIPATLRADYTVEIAPAIPIVD
jgi:hypothetical protein